MAFLNHYIQKVYDHEPKHPSRVPEGRIFPDTRSAPQLDDKRTNRILIYLGSFNPPHRGHLQLLRHTFYHGSHLLNIIGAIIRTGSDKSVTKKCREAGGSFAFGRDERCLLWKQDLCFPDWAWVYEGNCCTFRDFLNRLRDAANEDHFEIEYVPLRGPIDDDHTWSPGPEEFSHGASTMIISDAARLANYQRSNGYMRDFNAYSKWKVLNFDEENSKVWVRWEAQRAVEGNKTIHPQQAREMRDDDAASIERATSQTLKSMRRDVKNIIYCRRRIDCKEYTIRFVKAERKDCKDWKNYTSSTELRQAMSSIKCNESLKLALDEMALSTDILWDTKAQWEDKAKASQNDLIVLDLPSNSEAGDESQLESLPGDNDLEAEADIIGITQQGMNQQNHIRLSQHELLQESRGNWNIRKRKLSISEEGAVKPRPTDALELPKYSLK